LNALTSFFDDQIYAKARHTIIWVNLINTRGRLSLSSNLCKVEEKRGW